MSSNALLLTRAVPAARQFRHALRLIRLPTGRPLRDLEPAIAIAAIRSQPWIWAPASTAQVPHVIPERLARLPRSDHVNQRVPEALQRQHGGRHVFKRQQGMILVHDRVDPVGARRDPGNQQRSEEEQGALGVGPRRVVGRVGLVPRYGYSGRRRLVCRRALDGEDEVVGARRDGARVSAIGGAGRRRVATFDVLQVDGTMRLFNGLAGDGDLGGLYRGKWVDKRCCRRIDIMGAAEVL